MHGPLGLYHAPQTHNLFQVAPPSDMEARLGIAGLLGTSWDLVSKVISTLNGAVRHYKSSYLLLPYTVIMKFP